MNCRILGTTALTLVLALLSGSVIAQQKAIKDQLVGAWNVVAFERTTPEGKKILTYGENPKGQIYYGADGRFSAIFLRGDLPKVAANNLAQATPEEAKALVAGTLAYAGTYTVDEANKTINMRVEASTFPNLAVAQKRVITSLTANEVKFINPAAADGSKIEGTIRRVDPK